MRDKKPFDFWLFMTVLILLSMGLVMVFSASAPIAERDFNDIYYIIKKQLTFALMGIVVSNGLPELIVASVAAYTVGMPLKEFLNNRYL